MDIGVNFESSMIKENWQSRLNFCFSTELSLVGFSSVSQLADVFVSWENDASKVVQMTSPPSGPSGLLFC